MNFTSGATPASSRSNHLRCGLPDLSAESESRTRASTFGPIVTEYHRYGFRCRISNALHQVVRHGAGSPAWQPLNSWLPSAGNTGNLRSAHAAVSFLYVA